MLVAVDPCKILVVFSKNKFCVLQKKYHKRKVQLKKFYWPWGSPNMYDNKNLPFEFRLWPLVWLWSILSSLAMHFDFICYTLITRPKCYYQVS